MADIWLDKPDQWKRLADAIVVAKEAGVDSETYNQPDKTSPQHRTKIHCWSIGLLTNKQSPRGYRFAVGRVLPVEAIYCDYLVQALQSAKLYAHNASHDEHSFRNHGINLTINDSLQWLREACPGRVEGYGLKEAERWALGLPARPSFLDLVNYEREETVIKRTVEKSCICGANPCRKRALSDWLDNTGEWRYHTRVSIKRFSPTPRLVKDRYPVESFNPSHPRWQEWLSYSLADAVHGIELVDWLRNMKQKEVVWPW